MSSVTITPPVSATAKLSPRIADWIHAEEQGYQYAHPFFEQQGTYGRVIPPRAEVTDDGRLLPGTKFLTIEDALRPTLVLAAAGAQVFEQLDRSISTIGRIDEAVEAGYLINGEDFVAERFTTGSVWLGDAIVTARVPYSRRFKLQAQGGEQIVRRHIARAMKSRTEAAVFAGTGDFGNQRGLINTDALPVATGAISRANILADVQAVLDAGTDPALVSVFASSKDFSKLITADQPQPGTTGAVHQVGGFGVRFTPYLAEGDAITGQFSFLNVVYHERPELVIDKYTQAANGQTIVSGFQATGWGVSQPDAFLRRRAA
jgi:hypothetical protein